MEPTSPEASWASAPWASDPEEPDWWEGSPSPDHPGDLMGECGNPAIGFPAEEKALRGFTEEFLLPFYFSEMAAKTSESSARSFLKKLWKIVGSHHFQSIWWGNDGNYIVIAEKLFRKEVLGRMGPLKIFESGSMKGFILQLNLYGFRKMEEDSLISISIKELQAIAAAGSALGKLLFYYNPFFTRDDPGCLRRFMQGAGETQRAAAAPLLRPTGKGGRRRRRPDAQPAAGAAEQENDPRPSASPSSTPTEPQAGTTAQAGSAAPSPPKRRRSLSPAGSREAAPAPATAQPRRVTSPAPDGPLAPAVGLPALPSGHATLCHPPGLAGLQSALHGWPRLPLPATGLDLSGGWTGNSGDHR